jgi:hypothetical protein
LDSHPMAHHIRLDDWYHLTVSGSSMANKDRVTRY